MNTDMIDYVNRHAPGVIIREVNDVRGDYYLLELGGANTRIDIPEQMPNRPRRYVEDQLRDEVDKGLHRLAEQTLEALGLPTITNHADYQQRIDELEQLLVQARGSNGADVIIRPHGDWAGTVHRVVAAAAEADRAGRVRRTILSGIVGGIAGAVVTNVLVYVLGAWIA